NAEPAGATKDTTIARAITRESFLKKLFIIFSSLSSIFCQFWRVLEVGKCVNKHTRKREFIQEKRPEYSALKIT
ncbi:MAG: hypothetical protein J6C22_15575, partial [Bacteroides sp.]|nr:hypothetical protein [Bacteroides sp.]